LQGKGRDAAFKKRVMRARKLLAVTDHDLQSVNKNSTAFVIVD
jgi:hypothetical protein